MSDSTDSPFSSTHIEARERDLGGFTVRRLLPSPLRRHVGPFVFFDHFGPVDFGAGKGMDVRPHPHIALATITYLFDGAIRHRDSLGSDQIIRPGDVNWMVAGRGIVHSERTPADVRARGGKLHGLQTWVALPTRDEETEPRFDHHAAADVPHVTREGVRLHVIAGTAYGASAPTAVLSPTLYVHAQLDPGANLDVPREHEERALYVVMGRVELDGTSLQEGTLEVLGPESAGRIRAVGSASVVLVGGAPVDGPRHVWWNFVSSTRDRLERAKDDWRSGRFAKVPGDDQEFIPLPDGP
jgi:redox-sensitive bicupin YhaK (pirin superfamily)